MLPKKVLTISAADELLNARASSIISYKEYAKNFQHIETRHVERFFNTQYEKNNRSNCELVVNAAKAMMKWHENIRHEDSMLEQLLCDAEARSEALAALDKELNIRHRFVQMLPAKALSCANDDNDEASIMEYVNTACGPSERTLPILSPSSSLSGDASTAKMDAVTTSESHESATSESHESATSESHEYATSESGGSRMSTETTTATTSTYSSSGSSSAESTTNASTSVSTASSSQP